MWKKHSRVYFAWDANLRENNAGGNLPCCASAPLLRSLFNGEPRANVPLTKYCCWCATEQSGAPFLCPLPRRFLLESTHCLTVNKLGKTKAYAFTHSTKKTDTSKPNSHTKAQRMTLTTTVATLGKNSFQGRQLLQTCLCVLHCHYVYIKLCQARHFLNVIQLHF